MSSQSSIISGFHANSWIFCFAYVCPDAELPYSNILNQYYFSSWQRKGINQWMIKKNPKAKIPATHSVSTECKWPNTIYAFEWFTVLFPCN